MVAAAAKSPDYPCQGGKTGRRVCSMASRTSTPPHSPYHLNRPGGPKSLQAPISVHRQGTNNVKAQGFRATATKPQGRYEGAGVLSTPLFSVVSGIEAGLDSELAKKERVARRAGNPRSLWRTAGASYLESNPGRPHRRGPTTDRTALTNVGSDASVSMFWQRLFPRVPSCRTRGTEPEKNGPVWGAGQPNCAKQT